MRPHRPYHVKSYDFLADLTAEGRASRMLTVLDEYAREGLAIVVGRHLKAEDIKACLTDLFLSRGLPAYLRSDNGLVVLARSYRKTVKDYRLRQEYVTPYTPEQNGVVERVFRSLKEECVWVQRFGSLAEAERAIGQWVMKYNTQRPHESLGWLTPSHGGRNMRHSCPKNRGRVHHDRGIFALFALPGRFSSELQDFSPFPL